MRYTEIATAKPFEGAPVINTPAIYGASPNKPLLLRIPVIGERPMSYNVIGLPAGLELRDGIISGKVPVEGNYDAMIVCENRLGTDKKAIRFEICRDKVCLTPLLGFTSWNAFGFEVSAEDMELTAKKMIDWGIAEYGYSYINIDSGWQGEYGGRLDAIQPNAKFPDMKGFCDRMHALGFKCGIYSTPMLNAFGCAMTQIPLPPGCTQGAPDDRFADERGGIGVIRKEKNNALQWAEWGFDYLKYDWRPTDPVNAELMRCELVKTDRDFGFCVSVKARAEYHTYWKKYCNSYRCNVDSQGSFSNLIEIYESYFEFMEFLNKGHFFDLDMLDTGECYLMHKAGYDEAPDFGLSEDEQLVAYSLRAFLNSPIQISSNIMNIGEFELSMYCNEQIIAINQDPLFSPARPIMMLEDGATGKRIHVFKKRLSGGDLAICALNLGKTKEQFKISLDGEGRVTDAWAKRDMGISSSISLDMMPHTVRIFRVTGI